MQILQKMRNRMRRYQDDREGATAVEFALVAIPFFFLIFGIIELAVIFFVQSALTHAVSEAGRSYTTGNFQNCGGAAQFRAYVCQEMDNLAGCTNNVKIDVVDGTTFSNIVMPAITPPPDKNISPPPAQDLGAFGEPVSGQPVVIRATLNYRLALPAAITRLDNPKGSGYRQLETITAFRNEPFPDNSGTCPTIG